MSLRSLYPPKGFVLSVPIAGNKGQPEAAYDWIPFGMKIAGRPALGLSLFVSNMSSESIIKGGNATNLVSEMLKHAGYSVYRFGYEELLPSLAQNEMFRKKNGNRVSDKIKTMPDFVVTNGTGEVFLLEVKYRKNHQIELELVDRLKKVEAYWPETKLLLVHASDPYFEIAPLQYFLETHRLFRLELDQYLPVNKELVARYAGMIEKYLA